MDERVAQLIRQGQEAAQTGDSQVARSYLETAVSLEPDNVTALLWLSAVVEDPLAAKEMLERVVALEPDNTRAQQGLAQLEARLASTRPAPPRPDESRPRGTSTLGPMTGALTIEQELRAALRTEARATPLTGPLRGAQKVDAPDNVVVVDLAAAPPRRVLGGGDLPYRVAFLTLSLTLLMGFGCLILSLLRVGPFS